MPTPFFGQVFTFTQPDGSTIELRGWGDQHYAVFETLDGYTVTQNPATGYWEVARLAPDGHSLEPAPGPAGPGRRRRAARPPASGPRRRARGPRIGIARAGPPLRAAPPERRQQMRMLRAGRYWRSAPLARRSARQWATLWVCAY
jgi:hypothetical protein